MPTLSKRKKHCNEARTIGELERQRTALIAQREVEIENFNSKILGLETTNVELLALQAQLTSQFKDTIQEQRFAQEAAAAQHIETIQRMCQKFNEEVEQMATKHATELEMSTARAALDAATFATLQAQLGTSMEQATQQHSLENIVILNTDPDLARLRDTIREKERAMEDLSQAMERLQVRLNSVEVSMHFNPSPLCLTSLCSINIVFALQGIL